MAGLVLVLAPGEDPLPTHTESWVSPDQLGRAQLDNEIDLQEVCDMTSSILYLMSGRRFGIRREKIRPYAGWRAIGWSESLIVAEFSSAVLGSDYRWGSLQSGPDFLNLKAPVQLIEEVRIDGQVVSPATYTLFDDRKLVRIDDGWWPLGQDLTLSDTEVGTFSITYQWGEPVPVGGRIAAKVLALEITKKLNGESCALPDQTLIVSRQGITTRRVDPTTLLENKRTGLEVVDMWLRAVNPSNQRARTTFSSPESLQQLRQS